MSLLKHLPPESAATIFNDIVMYVEKSSNFYKQWGDMPGLEFRVLLHDINIKILKTSNDVNVRSILQKLRDKRFISSNKYSRPDIARDVILLQGSSDLNRLPITPTNLLDVVYYTNALFSLENQNVFTIFI